MDAIISHIFGALCGALCLVMVAAIGKVMLFTDHTEVPSAELLWATIGSVAWLLSREFYQFTGEAKK
jgi:hypothetical protein